MWYEILPCFAILTACLGVNGALNFGTKYFWNGTIHGRAQNDRRSRYYFDRDDMLMGRARRVEAGLEGLPAH